MRAGTVQFELVGREILCVQAVATACAAVTFDVENDFQSDDSCSDASVHEPSLMHPRMNHHACIRA